MREKGSFDFFNKLWVVGTHASVERMYGGAQFECGDGVTARLAGSWMGGAGESTSAA